MRGVILAAGKGARLNGTAADRPKCLVKIGRVSLLQRQIGALRSAGVRDIVVVAGYQADRVRREAGSGVTIVENPQFAETNSLYSLWLARGFLTGGFIGLNCDVLFHRRLLDDLLTARYEDALLVAPREISMPYGPEEMKVTVRAGRVVAISKSLDPIEADGENVGIVRFGQSGARLLVEILDRTIASGRLRDWAPYAFECFACERPLYAIGTRGLPWIEIDFPEDYQRAVSEVLPLVDNAPALAGEGAA
jgi:L-glutamine-phosphate cytidylyltransferase